MEHTDNQPTHTESKANPKSNSTTPITKSKPSQELKLKFSIPEDHPLAELEKSLKDRGVKNFDPSGLILEILDGIDSEWWTSRLENETPLEFKINRALSDPNMREKRKELISDGSLEGSDQLHS